MSKPIIAGMTGRQAIASIARKQGVTAQIVLKNEMRAHRLSCGRGALYRADIMGRGRN